MDAVPRISSALLGQIMRSVGAGEARDGGDGPPEEKCGILRGRGGHVIRADETLNVALTPRTHFEIDPAALIAAYRAERRRGALAVLGFFHTHPSDDAMPSVTDAACAAADGKLWLIATRGEARLYRAVPHGAIHGRFDPLRFDVVIGKRPPERVGAILRR